MQLPHYPGCTCDGIGTGCILAMGSKLDSSSSTSTPLWVQGLYGLWMCAATAAWFVVVSLLFSRQAVRQRFLAYGHWFERIMGVLLLAFALKLFLS